ASVMSAPAAAMVKAGSLRPLAVVSEHRLAEYPDIPTMAEAGYAGVGTLHWQSMLAPAATPKDVIATLQTGMTEAMQASAVQDAFKKQLIEATPNASPEEAQAWLKSEIDSWKKITREVKVELSNATWLAARKRPSALQVAFFMSARLRCVRIPSEPRPCRRCARAGAR